MLYMIFNLHYACVFRRYLRETLKMANAEDLNRLTACSLVLLGHIFLSLGNSQVWWWSLVNFLLLLSTNAKIGRLMPWRSSLSLPLWCLTM